MNDRQQTNQQDVLDARGRLAVLKQNYIAELTAYNALPATASQQRCDAVLRCQQNGNAYFNYAEEFVGSSDLLGAHRSALWAQGFAEDCAEILRSLPKHIAFLQIAAAQSGLPCTPELFKPGNTAYANMQRMAVRYLTTKEAKSIEKLFKDSALPIYGFKNEAKEFMSKTVQKILSIIFGVAFIIVMLVLSIRFPEPTHFQYQVFRTVLALAGAGCAATFPGFIEVEFGKWLRAGGALAVFVVLYFMNPAQLTVSDPAKTPATTSPAVREAK